MSRFTEFKYDKEKWELFLDKQYSDNIGHKKVFYLRNLSNGKIFYLHPSVHWDTLTYTNIYVGLEQISNSKFLEYYQNQFKCSIIEHYFDENGEEGQRIYSGGKSLVSLNDDKIWLGDWQVYSISINCCIETLKPFDNNNTKITLKTDSNGNSFLYIKMRLKAEDYEENYMLFVFDTETFSPALPVYSSLRDSFIELSDSFTVTDLIEEEQNYQNLVSSHMKSVSGYALATKAEEVLLSGLIDKA